MGMGMVGALLLLVEHAAGNCVGNCSVKQSVNNVWTCLGDQTCRCIPSGGSSCSGSSGGGTGGGTGGSETCPSTTKASCAELRDLCSSRSFGALTSVDASTTQGGTYACAGCSGGVVEATDTDETALGIDVSVPKEDREAYTAKVVAPLLMLMLLASIAGCVVVQNDAKANLGEHLLAPVKPSANPGTWCCSRWCAALCRVPADIWQGIRFLGIFLANLGVTLTSQSAGFGSFSQVSACVVITSPGFRSESSSQSSRVSIGELWWDSEGLEKAVIAFFVGTAFSVFSAWAMPACNATAYRLGAGFTFIVAALMVGLAMRVLMDTLNEASAGDLDYDSFEIMLVYVITFAVKLVQDVILAGVRSALCWRSANKIGGHSQVDAEKAIVA